MSIFGTDCSGSCETCKIHYTGGCLAGHGDNDYIYANLKWIEQFKKEQKLKDKNIYLKNIIEDSEKVIALHLDKVDMSDASKRLNKVIHNYKNKENDIISYENYCKYIKYIFETSNIKRFKLVYLNGEILRN